MVGPSPPAGGDDLQEALAAKVQELVAAVAREAPGLASTEVRLLDAGSTLQARWTASSKAFFRRGLRVRDAPDPRDDGLP